MKAKWTITIFVVLALTACSPGTAAQPTATAVDIAVVQTSVYETVVANLTTVAEALPTQTSAPTNTPEPEATATATQTVTPTAGVCDVSAFISDATVPDGTSMTAGQDFVKTWKVKNTGTCTWNKGYQIRWSHGEKLGSQNTALTADVQPGAEVEISITLKAPLKAGNYSGYFRLFNNNGYAFGEWFSVIIAVQ